MIIHNNPEDYPYTSNRVATFANHAMVATSQPLAAQIGLQIIRQGGNAVDAAVATAAALTVVEPTGCGIGGDAFALVWIRDKLHGFFGAVVLSKRVPNTGLGYRIWSFSWPSLLRLTT